MIRKSISPLSAHRIVFIRKPQIGQGQNVGFTLSSFWKNPLNLRARFRDSVITSRLIPALLTFEDMTFEQKHSFGLCLQYTTGRAYGGRRDFPAIRPNYRSIKKTMFLQQCILCFIAYSVGLRLVLAPASLAEKAL